MIQALAKALDAKKMTELRGIQTFLTVTGIDTTLRYPQHVADLRAWYTGTKNRIPVELKADNIGQYKYVGIDCGADTSVKVGTTTYGTNCEKFQLWTELEQRSPALDLDTDVPVGTAYGTAGAGTGNVIQDGTLETCSSSSGTADCVFDLAP
jgi:hypothetical protein